MSRAAIVTGVAGQDGSYLTEFLLDKGYTVYGVARYTSEPTQERLTHIENPKFKMIRGDMTDTSRITCIVNEVAADTTLERIEVYNLAAQSHVKVSFDQPEWTANVNSLGALRWLEAIRQTNDKRFRFYQAGTSEMFGKVVETPQNEKTPFWPRSPYGVSKVFAYWMTKNYREAYGMYACTGILFNHESPRRGEDFVTRKITKAIGQKKFPIRLGNLDAKRDWGHAKDYVEAMWHMLQLDQATDYVVASGETHSIREFVEKAFGHTGRRVEWFGQGDEEVAMDVETGEVLVAVDPAFYRPAEVDVLTGDSSEFRKASEWIPKHSFDDLVRTMVSSDFRSI